MHVVETVIAQLRRAARSLLRRPALAVVALLTLGLGIGANAAIFSIVNVVLLKPLPFGNPERLVMVWSAAPNQGLAEGFAFSPRDRAYCTNQRMPSDIRRTGRTSTGT